MKKKLLSLSVIALIVVAVCVAAPTAWAGDDGLVPGERTDLGRTAPELDRFRSWDYGLTDFLQDVWERILRLVPRLPGPEDKEGPPRPEATPSIDPNGCHPKHG